MATGVSSQKACSFLNLLGSFLMSLPMMNVMMMFVVVTMAKPNIQKAWVPLDRLPRVIWQFYEVAPSQDGWQWCPNAGLRDPCWQPEIKIYKWVRFTLKKWWKHIWGENYLFVLPALNIVHSRVSPLLKTVDVKHISMIGCPTQDQSVRCWFYKQFVDVKIPRSLLLPNLGCTDKTNLDGIQ